MLFVSFTKGPGGFPYVFIITTWITTLVPVYGTTLVDYRVFVLGGDQEVSYALLQMQLQAMERVEEQERELRRLSNLMTKHQVILRTLPERPQWQSSPTSPPHNLAQLRGEIVDVLPGMVNTIRGAAERAGQIPDLGNLPMLRRETLEDILVEQEREVPVTPKRQVRFSTSTPVGRPVE